MTVARRHRITLVWFVDALGNADFHVHPAGARFRQSILQVEVGISPTGAVIEPIGTAVIHIANDLPESPRHHQASHDHETDPCNKTHHQPPLAEKQVQNHPTTGWSANHANPIRDVHYSDRASHQPHKSVAHNGQLHHPPYVIWLRWIIDTVRLSPHCGTGR